MCKHGEKGAVWCIQYILSSFNKGRYQFFLGGKSLWIKQPVGIYGTSMPQVSRPRFLPQVEDPRDPRDPRDPLRKQGFGQGFEKYGGMGMHEVNHGKPM